MQVILIIYIIIINIMIIITKIIVTILIISIITVISIIINVMFHYYHSITHLLIPWDIQGTHFELDIIISFSDFWNHVIISRKEILSREKGLIGTFRHAPALLVEKNNNKRSGFHSFIVHIEGTMWPDGVYAK